MTLVCNLLKLTDYPISYSLIGLILVINGQKFEWDGLDPIRFVPLLTLIGLLATTLSITDTFGKIVKKVVTKVLWIYFEVKYGRRCILPILVSTVSVI